MRGGGGLWGGGGGGGGGRGPGVGGGWGGGGGQDFFERSPSTQPSCVSFEFHDSPNFWAVGLRILFPTNPPNLYHIAMPLCNLFPSADLIPFAISLLPFSPYPTSNGEMPFLGGSVPHPFCTSLWVFLLVAPMKSFHVLEHAPWPWFVALFSPPPQFSAFCRVNLGSHCYVFFC